MNPFSNMQIKTFIWLLLLNNCLNEELTKSKFFNLILLFLLYTKFKLIIKIISMNSSKSFSPILNDYKEIFFRITRKLFS